MPHLGDGQPWGRCVGWGSLWARAMRRHAPGDARKESYFMVGRHVLTLSGVVAVLAAGCGDGRRGPEERAAADAGDGNARADARAADRSISVSPDADGRGQPDL